MVKRLQHIALVLIMLLLGGIITETLAATVTYHILTKPFTTQHWDNEQEKFVDFRANVRVEALRCTSNDSHVGLPEEFKSPLATNFKYYTAKTSSRQTLYDTNGIGGNNKLKGIKTEYEVYTALGSEVGVGSDVGSVTDIYVTYDYDPVAAATYELDLTGTKDCNIRLGDRFLCFNKDRNNRPGAILADNVTSENLAAEDFSYVATCGYESNKYHNFHFRFKMIGSDPYNITIGTSYNLDYTFDEKNNDNASVVVKKEFKGSTLFGKLGANMFLTSDDHKRWKNVDEPEYDKVPGFYRGNNSELNPIVNSFAILNHTSGSGYMLVGSKLNMNGEIKQPNGGKYYILSGNVNSGNNPQLQLKTIASAEPSIVWPMETYNFKVKTPLSNSIITVSIKRSSYDRVNNPETQILVSMVPDELKRKYCSFQYFYSDAAHNNRITTFAQAYEADADPEDGIDIYVDYSVAGLPFQTLPASATDYKQAKWYKVTSSGSSNILKWNSSSHSTAAASDDKLLESHYAFIGDPYELVVINRSVCKSNSGLRFVGIASGSADNTPLSNYGSTVTPASAPAGYRWEIPDDNESGFVLREAVTSGTPKYWGWDSNNITYSSISTRLSVSDELPPLTYVYHIVRANKSIAIKASISQPARIQLGLATIPGVIRSSVLLGEDLTFYSDAACSSAIEEAPETDNANIYVRYTTSALAAKAFKLNENQQFNVKLNGEYVYWDAGVLKSKAEPNGDELISDAFLWRLRGRDPYSVRIENMGATVAQNFENPGTETVTVYADDGTTSSETRKKAAWVKIDGLSKAFGYESVVADNPIVWNWASYEGSGTFSFDTDRTNASLFIAMSNSAGTGYELMAATGGDIDAATTNYHIGRPETNTVKLYANGTYAHDNEVLKFELEQAREITYHLVDLSGNELLTVASKNPNMELPMEYQSPLAENFQYFATLANARSKSSPITDFPESVDDVYVTYSSNDLVSYNIGSKMYRLRFANGMNSWQEDGGDKVYPTKLKAIYPYCNGDCSFFIHGDLRKTEELGGAASTRTRWAWYVESLAFDPYHVKIVSRQQTADDIDKTINHRQYFRTYVVNYGGENHVVTGLTTPGRSGNVGTEYMVLGNAGAYKLVTTEAINGKRRIVDSFEQYWKIYETLTQKGKYIDGDNNITEIHPDIANDADRADFVNTLHSYTEWAMTRPVQKESKPKRFANETHYYHTVSMGDGVFNFEEMEITPALILLDNHGWEIMRKPLPTGTNDPQKDEKYDAIRPYNSPMVKKYLYWSNATKETGYHKYTLRVQSGAYRDPITVNGVQHTSTDLTDLPPITAKGVMDSFGDIQDQYVTYEVKEEYVDNLGEDFLVLQGGTVAKTTDGTSITNDTPAGGLSAWIVAGSYTDNHKWTMTRNEKIDEEMAHTHVDYSPSATDWRNNGFDPYNIQIKSKAYNTKFFTTNASNAALADGAWIGNGTTVDLQTKGNSSFIATQAGHDNTSPVITNQTFMAVADVNGNMQLMPRFDHSRRVENYTALNAPQTNSEGDQSGTQTTFMLRPMTYEYIIVDNQGRESLRYKAGGEFYPGMPAHFKSPLATNFKYYKNLTASEGIFTEVRDKDDITAKEITGSFAAAGLSSATNTVYVRYDYDQTYDNDNDKLLEGPWLTVTLGGNDKWIYYNGTLNADGSGIFTTTKPTTAPTDNLSTAHQWQWKFLRSPYVDDPTAYLAPDPYAVTISNREANNGYNKNVALQVGTAERYALLSHSSGSGYALAVAGSGSTTDYKFLNGSGLTAHDAGTPHAATVETEAGFKTSSNTISSDAKITVLNDISHTYNYRIISNGHKLAASADDASDHNFKPYVPDNIQSPLLNQEDYRFYGIATVSDDTYNINDKTRIESLYGIYDDVVYVRYMYDASTSPFQVPNERNATGGGTVSVPSTANKSPLDITGELNYNFIWLSDNMMYNNSGSIADGGPHVLTGDANYEWKIMGNNANDDIDEDDGDVDYDPYDLKIYTGDGTGTTYIPSSGTTLVESGSAQSFMLLKKTDYDYGILAKTGTAGDKLDFNESSFGVRTVDNPTKFIIFALATHKLYYNIVNPLSGSADYTLTYRTEKGGSTTTETISPTTKRTVALSQVDAGKVSLGDVLEVPYSLRRPYCSYTYYIKDVTDKDEPANSILATDTYQGLKLADNKLPDDNSFIDKDVYIDVVYSYNTNDDYTNQYDYKANPTFRFSEDNSSTTKWYTAESRSVIPFLVNYKYSTRIVGAAAGRDQHYTNDYLWAVVGDPYGFYMHNRYNTKNNNSWSEVMKVNNESTPANNDQMTMSSSVVANSVFEMITTTTNAAGYFRLHPVAGSAGLFVLGTLEAGIPVGKLSNTNSTEWILRMGTEQLKPYFDRTGYIGGLTKTAYDANTAIATAVKEGTATASQLMDAQTLVYTPGNIQSFSSGYYRLHTIPSAAISPVRYLSGYTHETEKTDDIPMHVYEQAGTTSAITYYDLNSGFTSTYATRGEIPIPTLEYDPASIFYFKADGRMLTEGLEVKEDKMTATLNDGTVFTVEDIGGAVVTLRNGTLSAGNYLNYNQSSMIYDLKYGTGEMQDYTKWCMQPVQKSTTANTNEMALLLKTNNGGDGKYYATFYAPFDVLLTSENDVAYICATGTWNTQGLHPIPIGKSNTGGYADNNRFIPAGTPVIIRTTSTTGYVTLVLPNNTPSSSLSCLFTGNYLEELLGSGNTIYSFGLPMTGLTLNGDGTVTGTDITKEEGVGFYINANPNKEVNPSKALWTKNNRYVYSNKIYYCAAGGGAPQLNGVDFVPVVFDGEEPGEEELQPDGSVQVVGDGCIYDLLGRKVATKEQVEDGTWRERLAPGIYILNGKKFKK